MHQPDLLPYSGFWHKLAVSDVMDLRIYDQFRKKDGYHRRVMMRDSWATLPVLDCRLGTPICEVRIDPVAAPQKLADIIQGRYRDAKYWDERGKQLHDAILEIHTDRMWQFNFELLRLVRDALGLRTPLGVGAPPSGAKNERLVQTLREYGATSYFSGPGSRSYMGDCLEFREAGIAVEWSTHRPVTGESILTILMDYDDPMKVVLA